MIIIISKHGDASTTNVLRWLQKYNVEAYRLNFSDFFNHKKTISLKIYSTGKQIYIANLTLNDSNLKNTVVWLRKFEGFSNLKNFEKIKKTFGQITSHIQKEYSLFLESLMLMLKDAKWFCQYEAKHLNKIEILDCARKCGLLIPNTLICNNKSDLKLKIFQEKNCITKCISDGLQIKFPWENQNRMLSTMPLNSSNLNNIPKIFFPSIVQDNIEKLFELRVFYLDGQFFSSAIFSQQHEHTKLDFRINLSNKKTNRIIPFQLPCEIEDKLSKLMKMINLNTGSIDMIYSTDKKYYFLEVNPAGQYAWLDNLCNYNIDKKIAKYLIAKQYE